MGRHPYAADEPEPGRDREPPGRRRRRDEEAPDGPFAEDADDEGDARVS